jgi:hypothetical protein
LVGPNPLYGLGGGLFFTKCRSTRIETAKCKKNKEKCKKIITTKLIKDINVFKWSSQRSKYIAIIDKKLKN